MSFVRPAKLEASPLHLLFLLGGYPERATGHAAIASGNASFSEPEGKHWDYALYSLSGPP
ncbi:MAG: hypothetical protein LBU32_05195 [Clostridiales bacterium]|nr:hypothetical protein [Clostridiales bacterium]